MKNILVVLVIMFCLVGERSYAQGIVFNNYGYGPVPVMVNVPVAQTVWVQVPVVVQTPVVYYPYYPPGNWPIIYQSSVVVEQPRCFFAPRRYYQNYSHYYYR